MKSGPRAECMSYVTPASLELDEETYEVTFPVDIVLNAKPYRFSSCDGDANPVRTIVLNQDMSINANYVEVTQLANVTFTGAQTKQVASGEAVKITVTKPDLTTEVLTATTLADLSYSTSKVYTVAGSYKAKAHGDADAQYSAWDSTEQTFTVALEPRTGTLVVTVA